MNKKPIVIRIFLSSPSDVRDDASIVDDVIKELNNTWAKSGLYLHLLRWETHVPPGKGSDTQEVINKAIGDDYDIFLGLLWTRIGEATPRATSGTIEEFNRALERNSKDPTQCKIMFYFKEAEISPLLIDPSQLLQVQQLKKKLTDSGVLYGRYGDIEQFSTLLRTHLTIQVQQIKEERESAPPVSSTIDIQDRSPIEEQEEEQEEEEEEEEEGFLDLMENATEQLALSTTTLATMTQDLTNFGQKINQRFDELQKAGNVQTSKKVSDLFAIDMENFASRTEAQIPFFSEYIKKNFESFSKAISLLPDFKMEDPTSLKETIVSLRAFRDTSIATRRSTQEFRETIAHLPRLTTKLNHSKRKVSSALDKVTNEFQAIENFINEVIQVIEKLLNQNGSTNTPS